MDLCCMLGEGGSFALFQGLFPPVDKDYDADRTLTGDSYNMNASTKSHGSGRLKESLRWPLLIWVPHFTSFSLIL